MRKIEIALLFALTLGVWALVLKPMDTIAHASDDHTCSGDGYGEIDGREVYVHTIEVTCEHY